MEEVRIKLSDCSSAKEVVQAILTLTEEKKLLTIALLWCWWNERNRGRHGERQLRTEEFQFMVRRHVSEWMEFLAAKPSSHPSPRSSWKTPPLDMVKINVDGAFFANTGKRGWGFICRDSAAEVHFAVAGAGQNYSNALHAETDALRHAVALADHLGVGGVLFETDSIILVNAMTSNEFDYAPLGNLFRELKLKLLTEFIHASVVHVTRDYNKPDHVLAALDAGLVNGDSRQWFDNYPDDVTHAVTGDSVVS